MSDSLELLDADLSAWWDEAGRRAQAAVASDEAEARPQVGSSAGDGPRDASAAAAAAAAAAASELSVAEAPPAAATSLIAGCMEVVQRTGLTKGTPLWMPTHSISGDSSCFGATSALERLHMNGAYERTLTPWEMYHTLRAKAKAAVLAGDDNADEHHQHQHQHQGDLSGGPLSLPSPPLSEAEAAVNSEAMSFPITLMYVLEQLSREGLLSSPIEETWSRPLRVHVIGASEAECQGAEKWVEVLQLLPRMPGVEITMVGPEVPEELDGENHELSFEDSTDNSSSSGAGGAGGAGEEKEKENATEGTEDKTAPAWNDFAARRKERAQQRGVVTQERAPTSSSVFSSSSSSSSCIPVSSSAVPFLRVGRVFESSPAANAGLQVW